MEVSGHKVEIQWRQEEKMLFIAMTKKWHPLAKLIPGQVLKTDHHYVIPKEIVRYASCLYG